MYMSLQAKGSYIIRKLFCRLTAYVKTLTLIFSDLEPEIYLLLSKNKQYLFC